MISTSMLVDLLFILCAFMIGSIPTGLVVARMYGVDIRSVGSGNIGATNVLRCIGKKAGYATFLIDMLKGVIPLLAVDFIAAAYVDGIERYLPYIGLSAMLGHCFSPFLKGKGGKGVATGFSVFLYLLPAGGVISIIVFAIVFYLSRYVSLGSILAAGTFVVSGFFLNSDPVLMSALFAGCVVLVLKHATNIQRLLNGTESRFGSTNSSP
jgi:acyl phosphate:glycerol-3-phosphate acyltransferase